jgi:hypothetical protein
MSPPGLCPFPIPKFASASGPQESFSPSVVRLPSYGTKWIFALTSMDKRSPSFRFDQHSVTLDARLNTQSLERDGWELEKCGGCTGCEPT